MIVMKYIALTGILNSVISDLNDRRIKTIEIRSAHNLFCVLDMNVGNKIFLTDESSQDVAPGTIGLIAKVCELGTTMHRIYQGNDQFYEERETLVSRIQLQVCGSSRVRKVEKVGLGISMVVEADEILCYDAR